MKTHYLFILFILLVSISYAQHKSSYYHQEELLTFEQGYDTILVNTEVLIADSFESWLRNQKDVEVVMRMPSLNSLLIYRKTKAFQQSEIDFLLKIEGVLSVSPKLKGKNKGEEMWARNAIMLQSRLGFSTQATIKYIQTNYGVKDYKQIPLGKDTLIQINLHKNQDIFDISQKLYKTQQFLFVEPDFVFMGHSDYGPNDTYYSSQWHLSQILAEQAWDITTGSSSIRIAIIEGGGFDLSHSELSSTFVSPFDAANNNNNPIPQNSWANHATSVAGCAAAATDNATGVAGMGFNCKIVPVNIASSVTSTVFSTSSSIIATAASYLINNVSGVAVVSNSYSDPTWGNSQAFQTSYASMKANCRNGLGAVIVASTGNDGLLNPTRYPASFPGVLGVGATDRNDQRCIFDASHSSNYGYNLVDVSAPGIDIYTTDRTGSAGYTVNNYRSDFLGTSAACPIVAGIIGLMASANPNLTGDQLEDYLEQTCDKVGGYNYFTVANHPNGTVSDEIGHGRVNACAAVNAAIGQSCGGTTAGHDFYIDNLVLSANSFAPGDPITIECEQWTSNPNGPAVNVDMEYRLEDMNGNMLMPLGSDNSNLAGTNVSHYDPESRNTTIPTSLSNGNYQICAVANTGGLPETNYNNNTQCQIISVSSGGGGGSGHDFYPANTNINTINFSPNDLIELTTEATTSDPNGSTAIIESIAELYDNSGNFIMQIDIAQGSNIGNGNTADTEYFTDYIPNIPTGNYTACVNVNYNNAVSESNTGNNTECFYIYINNPGSQLPNLTTLSNNSYISGNQVVFDFVIQNNGNVGAGTFDVYYLASDGLNWYSIGTPTTVLGVSGNSTYTIAQNINVCSFLVPNLNYDFYYRIDYNNTVPESDENDNLYYVSSGFVNCTPPLPNLLIASDNLSIIGNQVTYDFVIQNNGIANATNFWVDYFVKDVNNTSYNLGTGDFIATLNAGSSVGLIRTFDFCSLGLPNGSYTVRYVVDSIGNVMESHENDNYFTTVTPYAFSCPSTSSTISTSSSPTNGGTTSGGGIYNQGQNVTVTATPEPNWQFVGWQEGWLNASNSSQYSFTANGNRNLVAVFSQIYYNMYVTSIPSNGGVVWVSNGYLSGSTATLEALPNPGWQFVSWQENGNTVSTNSQYSFTVTGDRYLVANFIQSNPTYTINGIPNPTNAGTVYGSGNYLNGSNATLMAVSNSGWAFQYWSDNGTIVSPNITYSFPVTSTRTVVANFIPSVGIEEFDSVSNILVYPNPNQGSFTVDLRVPLISATNIEVVNNLGQVIHSEKIGAGEQIQTISLQNVAKGIYLVRIDTKVIKLIID